MDEMREALDKAAASPDPAVRNMAIKYQEMQQEFGQYEAFFNIYKQGIRKNGAAPAAARSSATRERLHLPTPAARPRTGRVDNFSAAAQALLLAHGQPMKLKEIYTTYQQAYPEDQTTIETFRQRLVKKRELITLVPRRGYWWAAAELPPESTDSGASDAGSDVE
jgi:hypothetical protein